MPDPLPPRTAPLAAGDPAPDFTLKDQDRNDWSLAEHVRRGDVVLCFFPLAFTGVCGTEMTCVSDEMEGWRERGASLVGISCDSFAALKAWTGQMGLRQTLLADMHREVCKGYGLHWPELNVARRATVVIGRDPSGRGRVKWVQTREPGKAMTWDEVLAVIS
jgi:peroxiredoxin